MAAERAIGSCLKRKLYIGLADCLVAWLVAWLAGWLAQLAGSLSGWLAAWLPGLLAGFPPYRKRVNH